MGSNRQVVVEYLERVMSGMDETERGNPCYFECGESYSWDAIRSQVNISSDFGQRYVKTLADAARADHVSLQEFLRTRPSI